MGIRCSSTVGKAMDLNSCMESMVHILALALAWVDLKFFFEDFSYAIETD